MAFSDLSAQDQARLTAFWAARDKLAMGQLVAEVEYNGERRLFSKPDVGLLNDLIAQLERQACLGSAYGTVRVRL